jgi:uncharacterized protein
MAATNAVTWFDIYVTDLARAVTFYQTVLGVELTEMGDPTGETQMMSFPAEMSQYGTSGALVKSAYSQPGPGGAMIYFGVDDCSIPESVVSEAGGKVIRPKFSIGEFGWVSLCEDTEGNMFGLNSMK